MQPFGGSKPVKMQTKEYINKLKIGDIKMTARYYYKGIAYTKVGSFNSKYQIVVNGLILTFYSRDAVKSYIDNKLV